MQLNWQKNEGENEAMGRLLGKNSGLIKPMEKPPKWEIFRVSKLLLSCLSPIKGTILSP